MPGSQLAVVDPATGQVFAHVADSRPAAAAAAVAAARASFDHGPWRWCAPAQRADVLERAAELLDARAAELLDLVIRENGSPRRFVNQVQVPGAMDLLRLYARVARRYPFESDVRAGGAHSVLLREPVGVVAAIVPWNSPLRSAMLKVGPALAAGCSVVLKPSAEAPLDALVVAEALAAAGLPRDVFTVVTGGAGTGRALVTDPRVDKVAFTGSSATGRWIMAECAKRIARVTLELGGKSAAIVLDDADPATVAAGLAHKSFLNSGQACVAHTRVLVPRHRHDEFADALAAAARGLCIGDPCDERTQIGPMVSESHRVRVENYIALGRHEGARVAAGGGRPAGFDTGWYVEPTVFVGADNGMRIAREEVFGPVVCVLPYRDDADAVALANDSDYGLDGAVWTRDLDRGMAVARSIRTGRFDINGAAQAPDMPIGGFKQSGIGREAAPETIERYVEVRAIAVPT